MKKKLKLSTKSLIKLYLLKYQIYKKLQVNYFNSNLYKLDVKLKRVLKIIYLYKKNKKKILFIGFPSIKNSDKQFLFISKNHYLKKILGNSINIFFNKKKPNLIVFNNVLHKDFNSIKELKSFKIPLILFGNDTEIPCQNYKINANLNKNKFKKFCFFLIYSILMKSS